jgi:hypothetical protein
MEDIEYYNQEDELDNTLTDDEYDAEDEDLILDLIRKEAGY